MYGWFRSMSQCDHEGDRAIKAGNLSKQCDRWIQIPIWGHKVSKSQCMAVSVGPQISELPRMTVV